MSENAAGGRKMPFMEGHELERADDDKLKAKEVFYMPGFDGTGPAGMGSMTGWGRGLCNHSRTAYGPTPLSSRGFRGYGRGFGQGRGFRGGMGPGLGRGRGYGRGFSVFRDYSSMGRRYGGSYGMNSESELNMLKDEAGAVKRELDAINERIKELESQSSE
jgi:hypothetical protein